MAITTDRSIDFVWPGLLMSPRKAGQKQDKNCFKYMAKTMTTVSRADQAQKQEQERSWSDLPPELLSLILSRLFAGDCVTFHAVCKPWQSISAAIRILPPPIDSPLSQFPCLMFSSNRFFHPICNDTYHLDIPEFSDAVIRASKYSWLLMTQGKRGVFFFNPFTRVRIELPAAPLSFGFVSLSFSSPPTSSDCVVFGVSTIENLQIFISTIKRGEESWTACEFKNKRRFKISRCSPVLYKGLYYCLGKAGNLVVYDPKENKCHWTGCTKPLRKHLCASRCQGFMVESDGELLAVFVACDGRWICVSRLDISLMVWETVQSLGDKMLFVSHSASFSETAVVRGTGNKIYFAKFRGNSGLFYSLSTTKYHSFDSSYSSESFYESKTPPYCTWIKPVSIMASNEKFDW